MTANTPAPSIRSLAPRRRILGVVFVYALFAALWIYGSDLALEHLVADAQQRSALGLYKGWAFVIVTSSLLYWLMWRMHSGVAFESPGPGFFTQLALLAVLAIGLTASAVTLNYRLERGRDVARLEAVSDLRAKQIDDWLSDRMSEALFLRNSEYLSSAYLQWQDQRDRAAGTRLLERMSEFTQSNHYHGWLLLDSGGAAPGQRGERRSAGAALACAPPCCERWPPATCSTARSTAPKKRSRGSDSTSWRR